MKKEDIEKLKKIKRHKVNDHFSYVKVSDIPVIFLDSFNEYMILETLLTHNDSPDEVLCPSIKFDRFINYLLKKIDLNFIEPVSKSIN